MSTIRKTLEIYEFIKRRIRVYGYAPTLSEIGRQFDLSSPASVFDHLRKLEARNLIKRSRRWRGIEIVDQEQRHAA